MRRLPVVLTAATAAAIAVSLAGCSSSGAGRLEAALRDDAATAARAAGFISQEQGLTDPADATNAYARRIASPLARTGVWAQSDSGWIPGNPDWTESLRLVAIEPFADAEWDEPVGALTLASRLHIVSEGREDDYCVRVEFDRWGVSGDPEGVACPDPLTTLTAPADTRPIIPDGAEELAIAALTDAGDATASEIAERLTAALGPLTGGVALAQVQVVRDGDRIGLAMSDVRGCLLVRADDEGVERLSVPAVLLQPGELGCRADTALLPDESFRPPH